MIGRIFWTGLKTLLPIIVTIAIIVWLLDLVERMFGALIRLFTGQAHYIPGMGLLLCVVLIFVVGALMKLYFGQKLRDWGERWVRRIPFVKSLYTSMGDLVSFFDKGQTKGNRVVMVKIGPTRILGLVTREVFDDLPAGIGSTDEALVFLPMAYNLGGYSLMISKSALTPLDMPVEQAMRFALTSGMTGRNRS